MDLGIAGRTAVVCASTGGLGRATAEALGAEGANVVVCGRRGELAAEVAATLPSAIGVAVDIIDPASGQTLVDAAARAFGPVDILVLNGPGPRPATASNVTTDDLAAAVATLLLAQQRLVALTLPGMRERGWGRILAVGSSGVAEPLPDLALSNVGRAALGAYLKSLAAGVARDGVTVNLLLPGRIATDRVAMLDEHRAVQTGRTREDVQAESAAAIPAGRYGEPAEFGAVAAFLCGAPASYVNGSAVRCDGGMIRSL